MANWDRGSVARQVVALIRLLEGRRYMPAHSELARDLGVCTRTVRRYIADLELAGWPLPRRGWHRSEAA